MILNNLDIKFWYLKHKEMNKFLQKISVAALVLIGVSTSAQNVGVNATGVAPALDAGLDINFTNKGLLIPRVSIPNLTLIGPITPGAGTVSLLVWNTNVATGVGFHYWDGFDWIPLGEAGGDWKILGNANTVAGTNFLGTTNAQALDFRTNNTIRLRIGNAYQVYAMNNGTANAPFYSNVNDINTGMYFAGLDNLAFSSAGLERLRMTATSAVFNELSYNYDFRVESNLQNDMFFIDGGTNRIGINAGLAPGNVIEFNSTGENIWLTYWENTSGANGALSQWYHTNAALGTRVAMGITNYSGSALIASAVIGLSINTTTTGSGGYGVTGSANNESGRGVNGTLFFSGPYSGWAGYFSADVFCAGTYFGSDRRLKRDIQPIEGALSLINQINPVSYYYDTDKYPGIGFDENRLSYGFIAQDLEQIVPEMVKDKLISLNSNTEKTAGMSEELQEETFKVVNYTLMIPITVEAIKEQQIMIEAQNKKIEELERMIKDLQENK